MDATDTVARDATRALLERLAAFQFTDVHQTRGYNAAVWELIDLKREARRLLREIEG